MEGSAGRFRFGGARFVALTKPPPSPTLPLKGGGALFLNIAFLICTSPLEGEVDARSASGGGCRATNSLTRKIRPMTPKQKRFVAEYRVLRNASEAARRAGYSEGRGRLLLRRPHVIAALKRAGVEIVYGINPPGQERAPRRPYERRMLTALPASPS